MSDKTVIVSACLLGIPTRYDGTDAFDPEALRELAGAAVIPVCPEQLGGLPTPRPKAWITRGTGQDVLRGASRVIDEYDNDATARFLSGAEAVLKIAGLCGAKAAFLKEKSPSCGVTRIHSEDALVTGNGVTAALLEKNGVSVRGF
ncbi:MAG: DUF523 domain-containing protein [Deltaproteobacteria bacterium]|nr:DUF523 domain-containing protein [Deltaproteobacteria bacterium]